jgi:hypothetical protein
MKVSCSPGLLLRWQDLEDKRKAVEREITAEVLNNLGYAKNDIFRNEDTGATYRLDHVSVWMHLGEPRVSLYGYRTYSTGRREARQTSSFTHGRLKKVVDGVKTPD